MKVEFVVLAGHEGVPSQSASPVEDRLECKTVQFPLVVHVEGPAEHVCNGIVGA